MIKYGFRDFGRMRYLEVKWRGRVLWIKEWDTVRKYMKRSGIRRLYCYKDIDAPGRLKLEFVLRGKVLFLLPLWGIDSIKERTEK